MCIRDRSYSERTRQALCKLPAEAAKGDLVAALLATLDAEADAAAAEGAAPSLGAVLVFLPGLAEIRRMESELSRAAGAQRWLLLPLHGELPASEQRRVFAPAPRGMRKVVLATNVAETSLTIPGVRYVVDCGREKRRVFGASSERGGGAEDAAAQLSLIHI